jgi:hypothetical protein
VEIGQDICSTRKGKGNGKPLGMPFPEEKKGDGSEQGRREGMCGNYAGKKTRERGGVD